MWVLLALCVLHTTTAVVSRQFLFADGSWYLSWILEHEDFRLDRYRSFAEVLTQFPAVLWIRLGGRHLAPIELLLGSGLYFHYVMTLLLCLLTARNNSELMLFPLASFFAVSANSTFFIVSESHVLASLFWPLVFLMLLRPPWRILGPVAVTALAIPTLRAYQSMVFLGPILFGSTCWRARQARFGWKRLGWLILATYFVGGTWIAIRGTMNPSSPDNLAAFHDSVFFFRDHLDHVHVLGLLSLVTLFGIFLSLAARLPKRAFFLGSAALAMLCLVAAAAPFLWPTSVAPLLHWVYADHSGPREARRGSGGRNAVMILSFRYSSSR